MSRGGGGRATLPGWAAAAAMLIVAAVFLGVRRDKKVLPAEPIEVVG